MGRGLEIACERCSRPLIFSVLESMHLCEELVCEHCESRYHFDEKLLGQLKQFEALCRQIHASEQILGSSAVAIDVGSHHVRVPFNILLTRLSSVIKLQINGKERVITFRVEPTKDLATSLGSSSMT